MAQSGRPVSLLTRLLACGAYAATSVSITLFNKAVFSVHAFNFPSFVTTLQILVSIALLAAFGRLGWMETGGLRASTARKVFPLTLFWWLYVVSGVTALRYLNVPMYSVLRRATTLVVVLGQYLQTRRVPGRAQLGGILLMVAGAMIAGLTDLTYSLPGYFWVGVCVVTTAAYLLLIKDLKQATGLHENGLLLYNNVLALPLMVAFLVLGTGELWGALRYPHWGSLRFQAVLFVSVSQAFLLNVCIFWCTTLNSALATTVTGQMKDIVTTGLGLFMFGDVEFEAKNITGVGIGLLGGILYAVASYRERKSGMALEVGKEEGMGRTGKQQTGSKLSGAGAGDAVCRIVVDCKGGGAAGGPQKEHAA